MLACGNAADGQLGTGKRTSTHVLTPTATSGSDVVVSASSSLRHSAACTIGGVLYSCGCNDDGQLGRSSRRAAEFRVVESLSVQKIVGVACGRGFTVAVSATGQVYTWGVNAHGQLGLLDREPRRKPTLVKSLAAGHANEDALLRQSKHARGAGAPAVQVAAGDAHVLCLCSSGEVFAFGQGTSGQLGHGTITSSARPLRLDDISGRGTAHVSCGGAHSMALTAAGKLYTWGRGRFGAIGNGQTRDAVRPTLVAALKICKIKRASAGADHCLALATNGLVFSWGKGGSGQLGHGTRVNSLRPKVVEQLREKKIVDVVAGFQHSLALAAKSRLYTFGNNGCGQLGLEGQASRDRPFRLRLEQADATFNVFAGGNCTFVVAHTAAAAPGSPGSRAMSALGRDGLGLQLSTVRSMLSSIGLPVGKLGAAAADACARKDSAVLARLAAAVTKSELTRIRRQLDTAFGSVAVLSCSFQRAATTKKGLTLDLLAVREAYGEICQWEAAGDPFSPLFFTLGRATARLGSRLETFAFDDPQQLQVLLVLLENPLLLRPSESHTVLAQLIACVLRLKPKLRQTLLGWIRGLASEYFSRIIWLTRDYLTFLVGNQAVRYDGRQMGADIWPCCDWLALLWECDQQPGAIITAPREADLARCGLAPVDELSRGRKRAHEDSANPWAEEGVERYLRHRRIVPHWVFQNSSVSRLLVGSELVQQYLRWQTQPLAFAWPRFPFLLTPAAKWGLLRHEARGAQAAAMLQSSVPSMLRLKVRREHLVNDTIRILAPLLAGDTVLLRRPLVVEFEGEEGVDEGGPKAEFFHLLVKSLLLDSPHWVTLDHANVSRGRLWFSGLSAAPEESASAVTRDWAARMLELTGAVVGLATLNGVMIHAPFATCVFRKLLMSRDEGYTLEDLEEIEPAIARSLRAVLTYSATASPSLEEALMQTFEATLPSGRVVPLVGRGSEVPVTRANRHLFVRLMVQSILHDRVAEQFDPFRRGFHKVVGGHVLALCQPAEVELLVCGATDGTENGLAPLRAACRYSGGYDAESPTIKMFWSVVCAPDFGPVLRRRLLRFVTGSDRVPIGGLASMRFQIQKNTADDEHLPSAHTCFHVLELPAYSTIGVLRGRLLVALEHVEGFGFA